jgi:hypothetical protein
MTDSNEFKKFNRLLTTGRPNYQPWYFLLEVSNKDPARTKRGWKHPDSRLSPERALEMVKFGQNIGIEVLTKIC